MEKFKEKHLSTRQVRRHSRSLSSEMSITSLQLLQVTNHVARGLERMHQQTPPIAHRDLKLEVFSALLTDTDADDQLAWQNVLLHQGDSMFKLCDFGSSTTRAQCYV